jgi:hypothetical protein
MSLVMADGKKGSKTAKKPTPKKRKLTPKEERLVDLITTGNMSQAQAYIMAGYRPTPNARIHAYKKVTKGYMQEALEQRQARYREIAGVTKEDLVGRLKEIAFGSIADVTDERGMPSIEIARENGTDGLLKEYTVELGKIGAKLHDPVGAIRQLSAMLGYNKPAEAPQSDVDRVARAVVDRLVGIGWTERAAMEYAIAAYGPLKQLSAGSEGEGEDRDG